MTTYYIDAANGDDVTGDGTTVSQLTAGTHTTGEFVRTAFSTGLIAANLEAHDIVGMKLWRDGDDGTDDLAKAAIMLQVHFEFTQNRLGEPV